MENFIFCAVCLYLFTVKYAYSGRVVCFANYFQILTSAQPTQINAQSMLFAPTCLGDTLAAVKISTPETDLFVTVNIKQLINVFINLNESSYCKIFFELI